MEKINIAELLKDCPKGMELDCTIFDDVVFEKVDSESNDSWIVLGRLKSNATFFVSKYGQYYNAKDGKCVIFPKGKTTWEGFHRPFKDGDVITCTNSCCTFVSIFKKRMNENIFVRYCAFILDDNKLKVDTSWSDFEKPRLATEEEKQKLFDAIKDNGYKWNEETKTLEKLIEPKFKVWNKIKEINSNEYVVLITDITDDYYIGETEYCMKVAISMNMQNNYELVPNKFDITTLVPFESRVLVRQAKTDVWQPAFYGFFHQPYKRFYTTSSTWLMCIPYNEDTKHLTGTTNDCDEFYKTWEKKA